MSLINYCNLLAGGGTGYVLVELLINGTPVPGRTFIRGHPRNSGDQFTVTGQVKTVLKNDDEVSVRVTPIQVSLVQAQYRARGSQCSLTVQKLRHFQ